MINNINKRENVYNSYDKCKDYYYREHPIDYSSRILRWGDLKNNTTIGKREIYFRGGILPYRRTTMGYFEVCLGITNNKHYKTVTLIGGGRDSNDNIILDTAIREFQEKTGGLLSISPITDNTVCYDSVDSTIFLVASNNKDFTIDLKNINLNPELSSLIWMPIINGQLSFKGLTLNRVLESELNRTDGLFDQFYKYMCLEALQSMIPSPYDCSNNNFNKALQCMEQVLSMSSVLFDNPTNVEFEKALKNIADTVYHHCTGHYKQKLNSIQLELGNAFVALLKSKIVVRRPKLGEIILDPSAKLLDQHLTYGRYYFSIVIEDLHEIQQENYYVRLSGVIYVIDATCMTINKLIDSINIYTTRSTQIFVRDNLNLPKGVKHKRISLMDSVKQTISQTINEYCDMASDCSTKRKNVYIASLFMSEIIRIEERDYFISIERPVPINTFDLETENLLGEDSSEDIKEQRELKTLGNASKFVEFNTPQGIEKRSRLLLSVGRNK